jgi:uncharacterized lipoprotein NlpE involved in copper resistance
MKKLLFALMATVIAFTVIACNGEATKPVTPPDPAKGDINH